jgi:N-acetylmuramoyl-L-alanine amidase
MLSAVRKLGGLVAVIIVSASFAFARLPSRAPTQASSQQTTPSSSQQPAARQPQPQQQQPGAPQQPALPAQQTPPAPPPPTVYAGPTIVLDPAHGGTDTGARGQTGAIEKDVVLQYARAVRNELEREGFHVVLTRDDDSNPSYDDRAALANSRRDAIFISLHVSSTGAIGTARVYYYRFASVSAGPPAAVQATAAKNTPPAGTSLVSWDEAQLSHVEMSHHLADVLQGELAQRFSGSPIVASLVAVRGLRSVNAPAVAIEVSSVSVQDPATLEGMVGPLAASIARGLQAFKAAGFTEDK